MASFSLRGSLRFWQRWRKRAASLVRKWDRKVKAADSVEKRQRALARRRHWNREVAKAEKWIKRRKRQIREKENAKWGGSRAVTNEVIDIVNSRARVTSRKRWELFGNPFSDHYRGNKLADAVDFAIAEAHWLKNEISRRLGGPNTLPDYGTFNIVRGGHTYRVQIIAGTHGTGPHLHVGVRRVS